ncbi:type I secretion system permease/ATPase [Roseibium sp. SCP14]|uniref:type I secretion system permease/ATPase n=1 Tax=Roseibium sp. SCP14 TaxID=3141375 RepID=UPI003A969B5C
MRFDDEGSGLRAGENDGTATEVASAPTEGDAIIQSLVKRMREQNQTETHDAEKPETDNEATDDQESAEPDADVPSPADEDLKSDDDMENDAEPEIENDVGPEPEKVIEIEADAPEKAGADETISAEKQPSDWPLSDSSDPSSFVDQYPAIRNATGQISSEQSAETEQVVKTAKAETAQTSSVAANLNTQETEQQVSQAGAAMSAGPANFSNLAYAVPGSTSSFASVAAAQPKEITINPAGEREDNAPQLRLVDDKSDDTPSEAPQIEVEAKAPTVEAEARIEPKPVKDRPAPNVPPVMPDESTKKRLPSARQTDAGGGNGTGGGKGRGGGGGGGGGSGGGGSSSDSNLGKRHYDQNFREVLTKGLSRCRRSLITVGIFSFFVNALLLAIPIYLFQISDRVLTSRSLDTLVMLSVLVAGFLLVHVLLDMARRLILMRIAVETETRLGPSVLSAAAKASQNGSNREYQTLGDLQQMRSFITGPVLLNMFDIPVIPLYMLAVYLIHPQLGYIVTCTGLTLLVIALINQKVTAVPFGQANAYGMRANLQADAMSRNAQVINAMGMIPEGVQIWGKETLESLRAQVLAQDRNVMMSAISKFVRLCTQIALLGWGAWLALNNELTGGMLIAASIVGSRALAPIEGAIEGWRGFIQARSAYARIRTLLLNSPLNLERLRLPRAKGRVTVERILYVPPPTKKVILNGISFHLEPGESLAIVGASGSGKSTLGRMLVGSIVPTAGNVRLDHMDLRNWDPRQFGESVGYLPQDVQLFPATIKANIARMREDANDDQIFEAAETADVHEMISQFAAGYETQIGVDGAPLSGGQKQRIGLARAFFGNPRMVVLDEPNSNLDVPGERALARALTRAKSKEITVIAITQRPSLLKNVDRIMMLKEGTVHAFGPRDEMLKVLRKGNNSGAIENNNNSLPPQ